MTPEQVIAAVNSSNVRGLGGAGFQTGGLGSFISRLTEGAVVDFIAFSFWPSFNIADACLTIAAFLMIIFYGKINVTHG
jgi:lipoprotein signal peptidase